MIKCWQLLSANDQQSEKVLQSDPDSGSSPNLVIFFLSRNLFFQKFRTNTVFTRAYRYFVPLSRACTRFGHTIHLRTCKHNCNM